MATKQKQFSEQLVELREARGYFQKEMAGILGVKYGTYRNWEYDRNKPLEVSQDAIIEKMKSLPKKEKK